MKWDYQGDFLDSWPAARRSLIVNQFCDAVRNGARSVDDVLATVKRDVIQRLMVGPDEQQESQRTLHALINGSEARRFAEHILWRESLTHEERERLKAETRGTYQKAYMAGLPPTDKQLSYLKALGCQTKPGNRLEASELIERQKSGDI